MSHNIKGFDWIFYLNMHPHLQDVLKNENDTYLHYINNDINENKYKNIFEYYGIKQLKISNEVRHIKNRFMDVYNLSDYYVNDDKNNLKTAYYGVYNLEDLEYIQNDKNTKYIIFSGIDVDIIFCDSKLKRMFNKIRNKMLISISDNIYCRLKYYGYNEITSIHFDITDKNIFKKQNKFGNSVFIYNGFYGKINDENKIIIEELTKINPQFDYIYSKDLNISYEEMVNIYKQCFICLRLTITDGRPTMVKEIENMGMPLIHNHSEYGIKWNNINDIENIIKQQYYEKQNNDIKIEKQNNDIKIEKKEMLKINHGENLMKYNFFKTFYTIEKKYADSNLQYFIDSIQFLNNKDILIEMYKNNISNKKSNSYSITNKKISISIIMSHRNRPELLFLTLLKLNSSNFDNFEVIIVDDRSFKHLKPNFINELYFKYPIKLITIENKEIDDIVCSSYTYNMAFKHSIGDIIIIQNPECLHFGDIPEYVFNYFDYDDYFCFPCYSSNNMEINDYIISNNTSIHINNIDGILNNLNIDKQYGENFPRWYQHKTISNRCLHFCTVISRNYFHFIDGFSEEYNNGFCYEDDDLILRIKNILKLNVISIDTDENIGVVHMFHGRNKFVNITSYNGDDISMHATKEKHKLNENIYYYKKRNCNEIACPKIFHYYWDDYRKFTYMNYYSLKSSLYYHPDYIHIIWSPIVPYDIITWNEFCHKDVEYDNNFLPEIEKLKNVKIIYIDVGKFLNISNFISEVHKSDLFRYTILNYFGGIWSDLDIVYIKKITHVINFKFENIFFKCYAEKHDIYYYPIGLLLSKRKGNFYTNLLNTIMEKYFDKERYQCIGAEMFQKIFENTIYNDVVFMNEEIYMNYIWNEINELFIDYKENIKNLENTVGFHWFNGSDVVKKYLKEIKKNIPEKFQGIIFNEKNKIIDNYKKIIYFNIDIEPWAFFYKLKMNHYIKILKNNNHCDILKINVGKYISLEVYDYELLNSNNNNLFIFDEISYFNMLYKYMNGEKENILHFLKNINYVLFFSELFTNNELQTIGTPLYDIFFTIEFLKNAKKIMLCNTKNINYLIENNIYNNIVYFPPFGYNNEFELICNENKEIDILFYGNIIDSFDYRKSYLNKINDYCKINNNNFIIREDLFNEEKDEILKKTKIVLHIPSQKSLHSFPWAKVNELMNKKIFFIIEENNEMYIRNLENIVIYYKNYDDLQNKLNFYLNNENERLKCCNKCYEYIKNNYNINLLFDKLMN